MTDARTKIVAKLHKTRNSIYSHAKVCGPSPLASQRGQLLVERYDDLKNALNSNEAGERVGYSAEWRAYCLAINADPSHTGFDCYC
jgi:hypothetical protein